MKGISKAVPPLATGATTELGELGRNKIFRKGITIPKKYISMLPPFKKQFSPSQINHKAGEIIIIIMMIY